MGPGVRSVRILRVLGAGVGGKTVIELRSCDKSPSAAVLQVSRDLVVSTRCKPSQDLGRV